MDKEKLELIEMIMKINCPTKLAMVKELLSGTENTSTTPKQYETPSEKQRFDYHVDLLNNTFSGISTEAPDIDEIVSAKTIEPKKNNMTNSSSFGINIEGFDISDMIKNQFGDSNIMETMKDEIEMITSLFKTNMIDVLSIYQRYGHDPLLVAGKIRELYAKVNSNGSKQEKNTTESDSQNNKFNVIHNHRVTNLLIKLEGIFKDKPFTNDEISEISANTRGDNKESFNNMVNFIMKKYNNSPISFIKQLVSDTASAFETTYEYINTKASENNSKHNVSTFKINDIIYVVVYKNSFTMTRETFDFMIANFVE